MTTRSGWMRRLVAILGLLLTMSLTLPGPCLAEGPRRAEVTPSDKARGKIRIDALVVHANQSGKVDPRLVQLQKTLSHLRFTGFSVLSSQTETVAQGQTATVTVAGGRRMRISFLDRDDEHARVRIQLFRDNEKKMDTTVQLPWNKVFVVGGPSHDGGKLVFPITVSY